MNKNQNQIPIYRQGDVLLVPVSEIPESARSVSRKRSRLILAEGEATGHHHSILVSDGVNLMEVPSQSELYLLVAEGDTLLEHQEHATIIVKKGTYRVIIQREYDPAGERRVAD